METYIKVLAVRGAPAIGLAGGYGMFIAARNANTLHQAYKDLEIAADRLGNARPTAVNLKWAITRQQAVIKEVRTKLVNEYDSEQGLQTLRNALLTQADNMLKEDMDLCRQIGEAGLSLLQEGFTVLTHCNAGGIATSGYGTALAPIYVAHEKGMHVCVYADETRPLLQGMRLTAWELATNGIDVTVICDSAAPFLMKQKMIDLIIVGADRIALNGDTANKIGTYGLAVAAKAHGIPFYVAAPYSTFDPKIADGSEIPIEERGAEEVTNFLDKRFAPQKAMVYNPAFDVTPGELISGIITEVGILRPLYSQSIKSFIANHS
jgi:methylthioribose-1-phosphate isomerase